MTSAFYFHFDVDLTPNLFNSIKLISPFSFIHKLIAIHVHNICVVILHYHIFIRNYTIRHHYLLHRINLHAVINFHIITIQYFQNIFLGFDCLPLNLHITPHSKVDISMAILIYFIIPILNCNDSITIAKMS